MDQLRKDCIGAYGNPYVDTPHIDRLASQGMKCQRAYVANPICMPNRLALFSGMYPSNHGVFTNGLTIRDEGYTLPAYLKEFGYKTASIGKIHFTPYSTESSEISFESEANWNETSEDAYKEGYFGFDYVELTIGHTRQRAHYYKWFKDNGGQDHMFTMKESVCGEKMTGIAHMPSRLHSSTYVGERTVNYIKKERDKDKPFFLSMSFPDPHHPFDPCYDRVEDKDRDIKEPVGSEEDLASRPEHYRRHYDGGWARKGYIPCKHVGGIEAELTKKRIAYTYAMIELVDENIGKMIQALEEEKILEDTIIIFTADHGELLGDHGLWFKGPFFYEGLINVPLIIYNQDSNIRGVESHGLISTVDIAPTICDFLAIDSPLYMDGVSHKEHLLSLDRNIREACLIEYRTGYDQADKNVNVLINDRYKYVRYQSGEEELTDLKADPEEKYNVAGKDDYVSMTNEMAMNLLHMRLNTEVKKPRQYGHA